MDEEHDQDWEDAGTIATIIKRFNETRLPRAKRMLERVKGGETLSEGDIRFLTSIYSDSRHAMHLLMRHPEYNPLATRAMDLYTEIITLGLRNEKVNPVGRAPNEDSPRED